VREDSATSVCDKCGWVWSVNVDDRVALGCERKSQKLYIGVCSVNFCEKVGVDHLHAHLTRSQCRVQLTSPTTVLAIYPRV
jgi:hypothetical protein